MKRPDEAIKALDEFPRRVRFQEQCDLRDYIKHLEEQLYQRARDLLIAGAAEAIDVFGEDELERYAKEKDAGD